MLSLVDLRGFEGDPASRIARAAVDTDAARATVRDIVARVRAHGDEAALGEQERFGARPVSLRVTPAEIEAARASCDPALLEAIGFAAARIRAFHERQLAEERAPFWRAEADGGWVGEETRPVGAAGCYVPGGRAAYPSTVLMTTLPARIAGVERVAVCVPPTASGTVHPATLAACAVAGVDEVYAIGGAQAIAAMAYGTETIRLVDVICGPGNVYVTLAKHEVAMDVGVDAFAGPTEVAIVADGAADPRFIAADLVAQAEHDPLATAIVITDDPSLPERIDEALQKEVAEASRREDIESALRGQGQVVLVDDLDAAMRVSNAFAPEHLELIVDEPEPLLRQVRNAGAVFVGAYSPVALGDYVAGTNHVLPTASAARFSSPLRATAFLTTTAIVSFGREGLDIVGPPLVKIAEAEGLDAHARALRVRLEDGDA